MEKIKLIVSDMDGTLLNRQSVISEYTIRTLHRVNQAGVKIVPISGRPLCHLKPVISNIQNLEYVATANGSAIIDLKCDRIL